MVFSSINPFFLDPPNWQQPNLHLQQGGNNSNEGFQVPRPGGNPVGGGGSSSSSRPNSMAERARLAKIPLPMPEGPHKCPRCESTNTKFCYFNNYSLSQPRHFCKTCRRYWTRGGALRNVPVGGGCRRSKKNKSSGAKSKSGVVLASNCNPSGGMTYLPPLEEQLPQGLLLPTHVGNNFGTGNNIGMNLGGLLQFEGDQASGHELGLKISDTGMTQLAMASTKFEDIQRLNSSKNILAQLAGNDQQTWSGNAWTDPFGLFTTSSSAGHFL